MATIIPNDDGINTVDSKAATVVATTAVADDKPKITSRSELKAKQALASGQMLVSRSKRFRLHLQEDGNLVVSDTVPNVRVLWEAKCKGKWPHKLIMRADGNLVVNEKTTNHTRWESGTEGSGNATSVLVMQNDGDAVVLSDGKRLWATNTKQQLPGEEPTQLKAGESIGTDWAMVSPNKRYRLVMQANCNLVLRDVTEDNRVVWLSGTNTSTGKYKLQLTTDGNLTIMIQDELKWSTETAGKGNDSSVFLVQDDGNLVLQSNDTQIWSSGTKRRPLENMDRMVAGDGLGRDQYLQSPNGRFRLVMQADSNLVLYDLSENRRPMWDSRTGISNEMPGRLYLHADGDLTVSEGKSQRWSSKTSGKGDKSSMLRVQDDGNTVLYSKGVPIWATMTYATRVLKKLAAGEFLRKGDSLISNNARFSAIFQWDGFLVIYDSEGGRRRIWSTGIYDNSGRFVLLRTDGNFMITDSDPNYAAKRFRWETKTSGKNPVVTMEDDGSLIVVSEGKRIWDSKKTMWTPGSRD